MTDQATALHMIAADLDSYDMLTIMNLPFIEQTNELVIECDLIGQKYHLTIFLNQKGYYCINFRELVHVTDPHATQKIAQRIFETLDQYADNKIEKPRGEIIHWKTAKHRIKNEVGLIKV